MNTLTRLLSENLNDWYQLIYDYESQNKKLLVPSDNSVDTLHHFNIQINELYTKTYYDYARARRNKDAIERYVDAVLKEYSTGSNDSQRKQSGVKKAKEFPIPHSFADETVDLFELQDHFTYFFYMMDATIQTLKAKAESKITNNSLLKLEKTII